MAGLALVLLALDLFGYGSVADAQNEPLTSRNAVQAAYVNDETKKEIAPQRRKVRNLAEALGVDLTELVE